MRGSGGTEGGVGMYLFGFVLSCAAAYLFFDSVQVGTLPQGWLSGLVRGRFGGWETTSMGILFVPFLIGIIALFYDSKQRWAWIVMYLGLAILAVEVLSRIRFNMQMKLSTLLLMIGMFGAGVGLMLRSLRNMPAGEQKPPSPEPPAGPPPR